MFITFVALFLLMVTFSFARMLKLRRHDMVLYKFCEIRRKAMRKLRDEQFLSTLSRQDYIALRKMIKMINTIIERYKTHKTIMFDLRAFVRYLVEVKCDNQKAEAMIKTENKDIQSLRAEMQHAFIYAFVEYTPFLKHEIVVRVSIFLLGLLAKAGVRAVNGYLTSIKEAFELTLEYKRYSLAH